MMPRFLRHKPTRGKPRPTRLMALICRAECRHDRDRTYCTATMVGRLTSKLELEVRDLMRRKIDPHVFADIVDDSAAIDATAAFMRQRVRAIDRQGDHLPAAVIRELHAIETAIGRIAGLASRIDCRAHKARHGYCPAPHTHEAELEIQPLSAGVV